MWESTRSEAALQHHLLSCREHSTIRRAVFNCSQSGSTLSAGTALPLAKKNTSLLWLYRKRARIIPAGPSRCPNIDGHGSFPNLFRLHFASSFTTAAVALHEQVMYQRCNLRD